MRSAVGILSFIMTGLLLLTLSFNVHGEWSTFHRDLNRSGFESEDTGPEDPSISWQFETGDYVYSSPIHSQGRVYVGSGDSIFYCLEGDSGDVVWNVTTGATIQGTATIHDGWVYVPSYDGNLYCLDADTGDERWAYETNGEIFSSPGVDSGYAVFGCSDLQVYCVDISDGSQVWSFTTAAPVWTSPAIEDGRVYIGSGTNYYCLNLDSGLPIWISPLGESIISSAAVQYQEVYVATGGNNLQGTLYLLDGRTGQPLWTYQDTDGANFFSSPAISERMVVIGSDSGRVHCVERDSGAFQWSYQAESLVQSSPAITGNHIFVGSDDGKVHCIDLVTGLSIWEMMISEEQVRSSPCVDDGKLWIGAWDGIVTCIAAGSGGGGDGIVSLEVMEPSRENMSADKMFTIRSTIEVPDENFALSLYYSPELNDSMVEMIVSGPVSEITGAYTWDTSDVPDGSYWIKAELTSIDIELSNWSKGSVKVQHGSPGNGEDDNFIHVTGGIEIIMILTLISLLRRRNLP